METVKEIFLTSLFVLWKSKAPSVNVWYDFLCVDRMETVTKCLQGSALPLPAQHPLPSQLKPRLRLSSQHLWTCCPTAWASWSFGPISANSSAMAHTLQSGGAPRSWKNEVQPSVLAHWATIRGIDQTERFAFLLFVGGGGVSKVSVRWILIC